ncbi:MAG: ribonuclease HI [Desulfobacteraceae bacterium]|nr:ribonuclease HI [Desulfobacteraceae bacterium]
MPENNENQNWKRMSFKGNKVWAALDDDQSFLTKKGKVLIKYNLKQDYEYWIKKESLHPENKAVPAQKKTKGSKKIKNDTTRQTKEDASTQKLPDNCIQIYTDGASSGNPGPSGIGVLLIYQKNKKEISQSIGTATNNIAELTAIKMALRELKRYDLPVRLFTDSSYCIGLLTKNWKPKKNQDLVFEIKAMINKFEDLKIIKVKGHAGIKENEVADFLATSAIKKGL